MHIDGNTRLFAIIGSPIAQVRAPLLFNAEFERRRMNAVMVAIEIQPARFDAGFCGLSAMPNLEGLVVTVPFKSAVMPFLQSIGETACVIGAANALRRERGGSWSGDMFDGKGFVAGLARRGFTISGKRALVVGAGGAGSAIAAELVRGGLGALALFDVDGLKAVRLGERLTQLESRCEIGYAEPRAGDYDLIVNATPLGMRPEDPLPIDLSALSPATLVADAIMQPPMTRLLEEAARRGVPTQSGSAMLEEQFALLFGFLTRR